jgi:hypothetical protein
VRAGAWAGYDLLWLILLAALTKSFLTLYLIGRYTQRSGESAIDRLAVFPGPRGWLLWVVFGLELLVAPLVFVVIAVPCGRLLSDLFEGFGMVVSYKVLACGFVTLAVGVGLLQSYSLLEKSQGLVCLVLLLGTVTATLLAKPDPGDMLQGLFSLGRIPTYPDWLPGEFQGRSALLEMASVFGYSGSIAVNYLVYSNWVLLKGWHGDSVPNQAWFGRRALRIDVAFNALVVLTVTVTFMVAGAVILRPMQRIPSGFDLLTQQSEIFAQVSPLMVPLYYVTILAALWGTLNALPDIYGRAFHNFAIRLLTKRSPTVRQVTAAFGLPTLGLCWVFIWTETTPIFMVDLVALFSTNIGVALVCVAAIWLDRQLPAAQRSPVWLRVMALASAVVISLMALLSAREVLGGYLG